jgi:uncharacterized protein (TIRG00374 family)
VDIASADRFLATEKGALVFVSAVVVLVVQAALGALRLRWIMRLFGAEYSVSEGFSLWMIGLFVSQSLVTFIAGDAARVWRLVRRGHSRHLAASVIVLERSLGFAVLLAMVLICDPILLRHAPTGLVRTGLLALAVLCACGLMAFAASAFIGHAFAFMPRRLRRERAITVALDIASVTRRLGRSRALSGAIILLSVIMHLCNVLAFFLLGWATQGAIGLLPTVAVVLPAMLIALMPISLAGWGVRESAVIVGYGLFGVEPTAALATSIGFGLALLVASLPGVVFLAYDGFRSAPASDIALNGANTTR